MKSIKFITIIISFIFITYLIGILSLPVVFANPVINGGGGGGGCGIQPFSFETGITPQRFQEMENIASPVGRCDILQIVSNVIGLLYAIVFPIAIIMIMIGGVTLITAGGSEKRIKQGKGYITSAIIGIIIALSAGIIIGTIIQGLGVIEGTTLMPWLF